MSVERDIVEELDVVLASIRNAEKNIIVKDSSDKLKVVGKLVNLEEAVKDIKNDISIPTLDITEDTLLMDVSREKLLSVRATNVLMRSGCKTVGDVTKHTAQELSVMRNMGNKNIDEIVSFLNANGFSLKRGNNNEILCD